MPEMQPDCEHWGTDLSAEASGAFIYRLECTICAPCPEDLDDAAQAAAAS